MKRKISDGERESKRRYDRWFRSTPEGKMARAKQAARYRKTNPDRAALIKIKCRMLKRYGITYEQYLEMLARQGGRCAMCGASEHGGPKTAKHFAIDHDHTTGKVRGLLCFRCNVCLGRLGDTKDAVAAWAKAAGEYLEDNMAKKIQLGEKVRVKTKDGEGVGTYVGNDDVSGMPIVNMEKLTVDNGVKKIDLKNVPAYVVPDAMRRG